MDVDITQFKYGAYKRKSSEEKDKQSQSIEIQDDALKEVQTRLRLNLAFNGKECRSAFRPIKGKRAVFEDLVRRTERGEVNAWLVWHPTRLARNPVDAGTVIGLMDAGKLHHVRTPHRVYWNTSTDKMQLWFEFVFSKKDSDDKSEWVTGGIRKKAEKGVPPGIAFIGFRNSITHAKGDGYWLVDEERFEKVKQVYALFLGGRHSVVELQKIAKNELRLTTPVRKRLGGRPLSHSAFYRLLANPIAAGFFHYDGIRHELDLRLPRMITEADYWRIQVMLGRKGRPRQKKHDTVYAAFMRDTDDGGVTADFKFQLICSICRKKFAYRNRERCPKCNTAIHAMTKPRYLSYVYYYSTKDMKARGIQARGIEERRLQRALINYYSRNLELAPQLADWCMADLRQFAEPDKANAKMIEQSRAQAERALAAKLNRLLDLRLERDVLSEEEVLWFDEKEATLRAELAEVREQAHEGTCDDPLKKVDRGFGAMAGLCETLEYGSVERKRDVLSALGSNLTLANGKVRISNADWVMWFEKALEEAKRKNREFEPRNIVDTTGQNPVFASVIPTIRGGWEKVRTCLLADWAGTQNVR